MSAPATRTRTTTGGVDEGEGEAQARRVELGHGVGHHEALDFGEGGRVREEASGMAVGAHTEQDQVEARDIAHAGIGVGRHGFAHGTLIGSGGGFGIPFASEADDHARGVALARERVEEGVLCHAVVAVGRGERHAALVAPEDLPAFPVEVCAGGQGGVNRTRGGIRRRGQRERSRAC